MARGKPYLSGEKTYTCAGCGTTGQGQELKLSPGSRREDPNVEQIPAGWWVVHRIVPFPLDDFFPPDFVCSEACARKAIGDTVGPPGGGAADLFHGDRCELAQEAK